MISFPLCVEELVAIASLHGAKGAADDASKGGLRTVISIYKSVLPSASVDKSRGSGGRGGGGKGGFTDELAWLRCVASSTPKLVFQSNMTELSTYFVLIHIHYLFRSPLLIGGIFVAIYFFMKSNKSNGGGGGGGRSAYGGGGGDPLADMLASAGGGGGRGGREVGRSRYVFVVDCCGFFLLKYN